MSRTLAELQKQFIRALHYEADGESCDISSHTIDAEQKVQIYRNNFILSLSDALSATYPIVLELVGEECFAQLARHHVLTVPLLHGDVNQYGAGFARSIKYFNSLVEEFPYLVEVAEFEWAIDLAEQRCVQNRQETHCRPLSDLAHLNPEQQARVQFELIPNITRFRSQYAVFSLRHGITTNDVSTLDLYQAQAGVIGCNNQGKPWSVALNSAAFELVHALACGHPLSELDSNLLGELQTLLAHELIAGFHL